MNRYKSETRRDTLACSGHNEKRRRCDAGCSDPSGAMRVVVCLVCIADGRTLHAARCFRVYRRLGPLVVLRDVCLGGPGDRHGAVVGIVSSCGALRCYDIACRTGCYGGRAGCFRCCGHTRVSQGSGRCVLLAIGLVAFARASRGIPCMDRSSPRRSGPGFWGLRAVRLGGVERVSADGGAFLLRILCSRNAAPGSSC